MRILVTGANGQLGRALQTALATYDVVALDRNALDVTDAVAVADTLGRQVPDWVVHCAALTDTTACEREPGIAKRVNEGGSWTIAAACTRVEARLIVISTNEVFDGAASSPYGEDAEVSPINVYGITKSEGERLALAECEETRIVRTSWLYGDGARNFTYKVLAAARAGNPLRFVTDETASPTLADDLAVALRSMMEREAPPGVYHLTNGGEASRHAWASAIVQLAGIDAPVGAITTRELRASGYDGPHKPPYSVLANTHARALGITLRPWEEALVEHLARMQAAVRG